MKMHTMQYISKKSTAEKSNEIFSFTTMWVRLEGIMLNELGEKGQGKYQISSITDGTYKTKKLIKR